VRAKMRDCMTFATWWYSGTGDNGSTGAIAGRRATAGYCTGEPHLEVSTTITPWVQLAH
jgi:hypothetical protein